MLIKMVNSMLAFMLLVTTSGFTISRHYCGPNLISVTIDARAKSCCDDDKGGCCHDELEHFQLKEDFVLSGTNYGSVYGFPVELLLIHFVLMHAPVGEENSERTIAYTDSSPPPTTAHLRLALLQCYRC